MRSTCLALAVVLELLAPASAAAAQHIELAGRVTASRTVLAQRRVGEARYVALSDLFYRDRSAILEVLDLATKSVIRVTVPRATLVRRFGTARDGGAAPPQGEIVVYKNGVLGVAFAENAPGRPRRHWYAELEAATGRLLRTVGLATIRDGEQVEIVGADATGNAAWFAISEGPAHRRMLVLRRLDLGSLDATDQFRLPLPARAAANTREHAVRVHAAPDFSRFAVVEYAEDGAAMAPGHVYILDPASNGSCAVPAPPTTYGVAFAPDHKYIYLGSAQRGTISRVDIAGCRIDKQVPAPHYLHHLVISPSGTKLFALASSITYAIFDLPDLRARVDAAHPAGVSSAMSQLYGDGIASLDGAFFVVPEADDRNKPTPRDRTYVIMRIVE